MAKFLTKKQVSRLKETLRVWVSRHPTPDKEALRSGNGVSYTPREMLSHVEQGTEDGIFIIRLVAQSISHRVSFEDVLALFYPAH
ncbi:MAG: hypothetical protein KGI50_01380 [Patescibacteria group bacterium]|nr:hypothetical protein [Patescibacteria group bacterium]MDE2438000.1 hypothetical protein [Patescibacteria group bacterium]